MTSNLKTEDALTPSQLVAALDSLGVPWRFRCSRNSEADCASGGFGSQQRSPSASGPHPAAVGPSRVFRLCCRCPATVIADRRRHLALLLYGCLLAARQASRADDSLSWPFAVVARSFWGRTGAGDIHRPRCCPPRPRPAPTGANRSDAQLARHIRTRCAK